MTKLLLLSSDQREQLDRWLVETGELYVDVHVPRGGYSSTGYFLHSIDALEELILKHTAAQISITIFRRLQYPLRGVADESMLIEALKLIPDGKWYTIVSLDHYYPSEQVFRGSGDSHTDLCKEFTEILGQKIAIGENPFDGDTDWIYRSPDEAMVLNYQKHEGHYRPE